MESRFGDHFEFQVITHYELPLRIIKNLHGFCANFLLSPKSCNKHISINKGFNLLH